MCENESNTGLLYNISFCGQEDGKDYEFRISRDMYTHLERVDGSAQNVNEVSQIVMKVTVDGIGNDKKKMVEVEKMHNLLTTARLSERPYVTSSLAEHILINQHPPVVSNLFRAFVASSIHLYCEGGAELSVSGNYGLWNPGAFVNHVIASFERGCYNSVFIEPTGTSGKKTPVMYFLKNTYDKNDPNILCLYNMGLLHKVGGEIKYGLNRESLCNYYVPFDVKEPDISQLSPEVEAVWRKILEDMRVAVASRFHR